MATRKEGKKRGIDEGLSYEELLDLFQKSEERREAAEVRALREKQRREEMEAQALTAEAQALREKKRREAAEAQISKEKQEREKLERSVARTDFHAFLSNCHRTLFLNLAIQENPTLVATGAFTNVDSKYYPLHLKPWSDFPSLHDQCQTRLEGLFGSRTVFPSIMGMDTVQELLGFDVPVSDEQDMRQFQFYAVEGCARRVLAQYLEETRQKAAQAQSAESAESAESGQGGQRAAGQSPEEESELPLRVYFSNNPYGILLAELEDEQGEAQGSDEQPAYMPAMLEAQKRDLENRGRALDGTGPPPEKRKVSPTRKFHPDQWCMRQDNDGSVLPVFVVEYKAAHKLRAHLIQQALSVSEPGLFATVMREEAGSKVSQDAAVKDAVHARKATAAVLAQAFHYMVEFGLCYCYVSSGEAMVMLYLDESDAQTLYYHLAVPKEDVGPSEAEQLRLTSVSLVTTMALLALDGLILSQRWKRNARSVLQKWPMPYDEMELSEGSQGGEDKIQETPQLPAPPGPKKACQDPTKPVRRRRREDDDSSNTDYSASRHEASRTAAVKYTYATRYRGNQGQGQGSGSPSQGGGGGGNQSGSTKSAASVQPPSLRLPYCTQACLLGLRRGGLLDPGCPNVHLHQKRDEEDTGGSGGCGHHPLTAGQFCQRMREQLAEDMDVNCDALDRFGKFGAIGMLFRLTLAEFGYCVVAKGVQRAHAGRLRQEASMYEHLQAQQGQLVPVCLGVIDLEHEYWTTVGAHIAHMMLMSYAGEPVLMCGKVAGAPPPEKMVHLMEDAWMELRQLGVWHGDEREPNAVWNTELQRVMCIDLEWAKIKGKRKTAKRLRLEGAVPATNL